MVIILNGIYYCRIADTKKCTQLMMHMARAGLILTALAEKDFNPNDKDLMEVSEEEFIEIAFSL